ncbi:MAG: AMP-binding protein [Betaproteobacteria bacterium]
MFSLTLGELLDRTATANPETEAAVFPEFGIRWTYAEFRRACERAAKGFLAMGVEPGDHVAIWTTNRPEWLISQFALGKLGGVLVTVNTNYKVFELEYLLRQSDSTTLILIDSFKDADYIATIYEICPELKTAAPGCLRSERLPKLKNVIYLGEKAPAGMFTWEELVAMGEGVSDAELRARQAALRCDDVVNIQYTSGTTGFPKGVMLTHRNIIADAKYIADCMKLTHQDRLCLPVPFFHCFGCVLGTLAAVTAGATMVPLDHFSPKKVMEVVQSERCTALHGVPTMFVTILEHPEFDQYDFSSLRTGIMAGAPCPEEVMRKVIDRMHAREITIAYGLTEAAPVMTQTRTDDPLERRVSTVGQALPNIEVRIVDPVTNEEVPRGTVGEVVCRGFNVMKGYYKMPEATAQAVDQEGWLHSGDLGTMDEDGYVRITGRIKDLIIRGGENIYPREIEEYLYRHPKVADAQVVGVPSPVYGEEVMAFVRLKPGETANEAEIQEFLRARISRHKVPRYVRFVTEYPTTASGKIQKYKLREMAAAELERATAAVKKTG